MKKLGLAIFCENDNEQEVEKVKKQALYHVLLSMYAAGILQIEESRDCQNRPVIGVSVLVDDSVGDIPTVNTGRGECISRKTTEEFVKLFPFLTR